MVVDLEKIDVKSSGDVPPIVEGVVKAASKPEIDPVVDFVAGTFAGVAGLVVAHPFDTVKVRFQNPQTAIRYKSTIHAFLTIPREEGFRGLYKGIASPIAWCAPLNGLIFASYRFLMRVQVSGPDQEPTLTQVCLAGTGSGIVSSLLTSPIELIKIRQQIALDLTSSRLTAREVTREIIKARGITGLYRGITATMLRDVGYGPYFASYEGALRFFKAPPGESGDGGSLSWPALLAAGAFAGINGWLATFAFDVVKTRVQSVDRYVPPPLSSNETPASLSPVGQSQPAAETTANSPKSQPLQRLTSSLTKPALQTHPYNTTLSTIIHSYRAEGPIVFFRGMSPTLIRAVPVNMATFAVFEGVVQLLS